MVQEHVLPLMNQSTNNHPTRSNTSSDDARKVLELKEIYEQCRHFMEYEIIMQNGTGNV